MTKLLLILATILATQVAELNLKLTAPDLPGSFRAITKIGFKKSSYILGRVAFFSGLSLLTTWYCYKRFGFLELILVQSSSYVFALLVGRIWFREHISVNRVLGMIMVMTGIGLFYFK